MSTELFFINGHARSDVEAGSYCNHLPSSSPCSCLLLPKRWCLAMSALCPVTVSCASAAAGTLASPGTSDLQVQSITATTQVHNRPIISSLFRLKVWRRLRVRCVIRDVLWRIEKDARGRGNYEGWRRSIREDVKVWQSNRKYGGGRGSLRKDQEVWASK